MRYISTRRGPNTPTRSFSDILLEGLAPDGGLYLPEEYPTLSRSDLDELRIVLREDGYAAMAAGIISLFVDDIPADDLSAITARAYRTPAFSDPQIVPVDALDGTDLHIAHLSNGPTAAFKDMAMQSSVSSSNTSSPAAATGSPSSELPPVTPAPPPSMRCAADAASPSSCSPPPAA